MKGGVAGLATAERQRELGRLLRGRTADSGAEPNHGRPERAKNSPAAPLENASAHLSPAEPGILGWKAFLPPGAGGAAKDGKPKQLNTATIWRLSKKLIAQEWARAKGHGQHHKAQELAQFEHLAAEYQQEQETKKKLEAHARRRAARLIHLLRESLSSFSRSLCDLPPEEHNASAEELLRESLCSVGDVDHIRWSPDGCEITFEPWEERRARRKNRRSLPVLFRASVDEQLRLTGCVPLTGKEYEVSRRESILDRILASLGRDGRSHQSLQNALGQIGRIIRRLTMPDGGIKVSVELWEEVRRRRIDRGGRPPIKAYMVSADAAMENIRCEPC